METHTGSFKKIVIQNSLSDSMALLDRLNEATVSQFDSHYAGIKLPYPLSYRGLVSQINSWNTWYQEIMSHFGKPINRVLDPMDPDLNSMTDRWANILPFNDMYCHAMNFQPARISCDLEINDPESYLEGEDELDLRKATSSGKHVRILEPNYISGTYEY